MCFDKSTTSRNHQNLHSWIYVIVNENDRKFSQVCTDTLISTHCLKQRYLLPNLAKIWHRKTNQNRVQCHLSIVQSLSRHPGAFLPHSYSKMKVVNRPKQAYSLPYSYREIGSLNILKANNAMTWPGDAAISLHILVSPLTYAAYLMCTDAEITTDF